MNGSSQEQLVLALETTAPRPGAALGRASAADVCLLAEEYLGVSSGRSEELVAVARAVLECAGARVGDLAAIAVVDGPGSYTGLRIGLGLARGLAFVDAVPVVTVGSLELIAESAPARSEQVCAALDAGRGKVYAAGLGRLDDTWTEVHAAFEIAAEELDEVIGAWGGAWPIYGDETLGAAIRLEGVAPSGRAGALARVGARGLRAGRVISAERALPRYVGATGARPNRAGIAEGRVLVR